MNPLLDQMAVVAIVCGALAFFLVRFWRKRTTGKSCDSGCGCGTAKVGKSGRGKSKDLPSF